MKELQVNRDYSKLYRARGLKNNWKEILPESIIRGITYFILILLIVFLLKIFVEGIGVISWEFVTGTPKNNMTEGGIGPAIFGTLAVTILMMFFAIPVGVCAAVYINEYSQNRFFKKLVRISVNNLAGVPSIVVGLFGFSFFVLFIGRNLDEILQTGLLLGRPIMLWASATLAVLVLPTIIVTSIEALNAVPDEQRAASYGLGATKWQTIKNVVLPQARPGILTGIILSVSRGAGETAPVLFLGCAFFLPDLPVSFIDLGLFSIPMINPAQQFMYLTYHIFILATQSSNPTVTKPIQFGTALVLISLIVVLNFTAVLFRYKFRRLLEDVRGY